MKLALGVCDPGAANEFPRMATTPSASPVQVNSTPCDRLIVPIEFWLVQSSAAEKFMPALKGPTFSYSPPALTNVSVPPIAGIVDDGTIPPYASCKIRFDCWLQKLRVARKLETRVPDELGPLKSSNPPHISDTTHAHSRLTRSSGRR